MLPSPHPVWIAPVFLAHLGCPSRCVFCNQNLIAETVSPATPSEVRGQLNTFFRSRKRRVAERRQIAFYGGNFTGMPTALQAAYLEVSQPFVKRGWVDSIRISTRPDEASEEQLAFVASRGVKTVELGIQSLSDQVLRASRRGYTAQEATEAIERVRAAGLEVGAQVMVGLPEDRGQESLMTAGELCGLNPDFVRIYPLLVLRQTELAERMQKGQYTPLDLEEAIPLCARMLEKFEGASIPVIRIGLQEQVGIGREGDFVMAGPYHPAFGHLVRSALFFQKVVAALPGSIPSSSTVRLRIHPHDRPLLVGDRRQNLRKIDEVLGSGKIRIEEDRCVPRGTVQCSATG